MERKTGAHADAGSSPAKRGRTGFFGVQLYFSRIRLDIQAQTVYDSDINLPDGQSGEFAMNSTNVDAKERILRASIQLFSEKGFDATSVTEIARSAGVTKALIYYYFKSKEEILDSLVQSLQDRVTSIKMDFVHANIVQMIQDGRLDITPDRLSFASEEDTSFFLENGYKYFKTVLDFALENRGTIRILMFESLKSSKNRYELFHLMNLTVESREDPVFKTISQADNDFNYSADMVMFKFFYTTFPLVNFVVYYDDYKTASGQNDEELRASFLQTFRIISSSLISGKDILLRNEN